MNQTVARIVEIMFQDTEMTDEVQALKDEVMNNCQERYEDMLARGMSEDEAIGAVVDSLKGMEEVIGQYPRKASAVEEEDDEELDKDLLFDPEEVKLINVMMTSDDINFETSTDEYIHVYYNKEEMPNLRASLQNGVLKIVRESTVHYQAKKTEWKKNADGSEWRSLSDMLSGIGKMLKNLEVNIQVGIGGGVTIAVPQDHAVDIEVHATSGDIDIDGLWVRNALIGSTSGDLTMNIPEHVQPEQICVKGSSGDVEINANTAALKINTVSGDVEVNGDCPDIYLYTISGDAELNGRMETVQLKTVSGDVDMYVQGEKLRSVTCNTTSGDLTVHLPVSLRGQVSVAMYSTSGDVYNQFGDVWGAPAAHVVMHSISGDLTVC